MTRASTKSRLGWILLGVTLLICTGAYLFATLRQEKESAPASAAEGTLTIRVPAAVIGFDYWVYANKKIVSATHSNFHSNEQLDKTRQMMNIRDGGPNSTYIQRPPDVAPFAKCLDEKFTYDGGGDTNGLKESLFQDVTIKLPPGKYVIELMANHLFSKFEVARDDDVVSNIPWAVTQHPLETVIEPGQHLTVEAGIPNGTWVPRHLAPPFALKIVKGDERIADLLSDFHDRENRFEIDPLARELSRLAGESTIRLPVQMVLNEVGGSREFDSSQISELVDGTVRSFRYDCDADRIKYWESQAPGHPEFFAQFLHDVDAYNQKVDSLSDIVRKIQLAEAR